MSDTDRFLPLYVGATLALAQGLTTEQFGALVLLWIYGWTHEGLVPLDEEQQRVIARLDGKRWRSAKQAVLGSFTRTPEGYRQPDLDAHLARARALVDQRSGAGKASAARRSAQRKGNERSTSVATGNATSEGTDGQRNGRTSTLHISDADASGAAAPPDRPPTIWDVGEKLLGSRSYVGKLITDYGEANVTAAIARLSTLNVNEPRAWIKGVLDAEKRNGSAGRSTRSERYAETIAGLTGGRSNEPIDGTADRVD